MKPHLTLRGALAVAGLLAAAGPASAASIDVTGCSMGPIYNYSKGSIATLDITIENRSPESGEISLWVSPGDQPFKVIMQSYNSATVQVPEFGSAELLKLVDGNRPVHVHLATIQEQGREEILSLSWSPALGDCPSRSHM